MCAEPVARHGAGCARDALGILVDLATVVGMLGVMFWLDWNFALIVVASTPVLLLAIARFRRAVKAATHERRQAGAARIPPIEFEPAINPKKARRPASRASKYGAYSIGKVLQASLKVMLVI